MYTLIDKLEDLTYLNNELLSKDFVSVDTEFRRTHKDNMKLALIQVNDQEEIYIIDTILIEDPKKSASFLLSDKVQKVLHSCKEDLEAIQSWTGSKVANIFDTQIANALLNDEFSISYQNLVFKKLGIELEKKETRSNWLKRPLSENQLKYASLDVEYLNYIYTEQLNELRCSEKLDWHDQEIQKILEQAFSSHAEIELVRSISKSEENILLEKFNNIIKEISLKENINPTFFFSKKSQKDFLRLSFQFGFDKACMHITEWRKNLIKQDLSCLLK